MGNKKLVSAIMMGIGPKPEEDESGPSFEEVSHVIASDIMKAVNDGDTKSLAVHLKAFFDECDANEDGAEEEGE